MKNFSAITNWRISFQSSRFRYVFIITGFVLLISAFCFSRFLIYVESRPGVIVPDPVLSLFHPNDITWLTFIIIYLSVILALINLLPQPGRLLMGIQAYIFLLLVRMPSMYLLPLEAPESLIPLEDPFVQSLGSGVLTKDLFFSGHASTLFLLYLVTENRNLKTFFLFATLSVAACVVWQHVHYVIDVVAAPFYAYACYRASLLFNRWLFRNLSGK